MARGRVKWFNETRGFGLIERLDGMSGAEIFVHYSSIVTPLRSDGFKTLAPGQEVEFDLYDSPKGILAKNVKMAG